MPQGALELALEGIPLSELNAEELTEALAALPGLGKLPTGTLEEALSKTLATLTGKGDTLGQLTNPADVVSMLETELKSLLTLPELLSLLKGESLTTLLNGVPVPVIMTVTVNFKLA